MENDLAGMDTDAFLIHNDYAYPSDAANESASMLRFLRLIIMVLTMIALFSIVRNLIRSRAAQWQLWLLLGAEPGQIRRYLAKEAMTVFFVSAFIEFPLAFALLWVYGKIAGTVPESMPELCISLPHLFLSLSAMAGILLLVYTLSSLRISQYNRLQAPSRIGWSIPGRDVRRHSPKRELASMWSLLLREYRAGSVLRWCRVLTTSVFLMVLCIGIREIQSEWDQFHTIAQNYGSSYVIEAMQGTDYLSRSVTGLDADALIDLDQLYEIENVETMYRLASGTFRTDPEAACEERLSRDMLSPDVWGIDEGRFLGRLLRNIDVGELDPAAFAAGEEAILVLPADREPTDESGIRYISDLTEAEVSSEESFIRSGFRPGASLTVTHDGQSRSIRIAALIYDFTETDQYAKNLCSACTLICGKTFIEQFRFVSSGSRLQYARVEAGPFADESTDRLLRRALIGSGVTMTNYREKLALARQSLYRTGGLWGILLPTAAGLCLYLGSILRRLEDRGKIPALRVWNHLGISEIWLLLEEFFSRSMVILLSTAISALLLSARLTRQINLTIEDPGLKKAFAFRVGIDPRLYFAFSAGLLLLTVTAGLLHRRKLIQAEEGERRND